jgi:hypothetical protein
MVVLLPLSFFYPTFVSISIGAVGVLPRATFNRKLAAMDNHKLEATSQIAL